MAEQEDEASRFSDPLGVHSATSCGDDSDEFDFEFYLSQISPMTNASKNLASLNLNDDDYEGTSASPNHKPNNFYDTDEHDLFILIDNPEKHATTMETFITFRVSTKTTRTEYECKDFKVRRRYNDFQWLKSRLEESHPALLVPPLPNKHGLKHFDRFNQDFIRLRLLALQTFLQRISEHPILSYSEHLRVFLTAKQMEFDSWIRDQSANQTGIVSRLTGHLPAWIATSNLKEGPAESQEEINNLLQMQEKLSSLEKTTQSIVKEEIDLLIELNDWGPLFTFWSNSEDELSPTLNAMAKAIERSYMGLQDLIESTEQHLLGPLKEYILYIDSIKAVFRRVENIRLSYASALNSLAVCTDDETEKQRLQLQCNLLADKWTCADADLKADLDRWHHNRRKDFRRMLSAIADRRIKYYQKSLNGWENTKSTISKSYSSLKNK